MLKRYSFFGVTLELIVVMGVFFVLLVAILIAARREAVRTVNRSATADGGKGRLE